MEQKTESLSPFLPGTKIQFAWDSTSLGWLKTCPRLYEYSMIEGWRSHGPSVHLDFGQYYHHALELYDRHRAAGADYAEALYDRNPDTMDTLIKVAEALIRKERCDLSMA